MQSSNAEILSDISSELVLYVHAPKCPECGNFTSWIGPKFRAPKKSNISACKSIKILNEIGTLRFLGFVNDNITIPESENALCSFNY